MLQICWKWVEEKTKDKSCFLDKAIKARKKPKRKKRKENEIELKFAILQKHTKT